MPRNPLPFALAKWPRVPTVPRQSGGACDPISNCSTAKIATTSSLSWQARFSTTPSSAEYMVHRCAALGGSAKRLLGQSDEANSGSELQDCLVSLSSHPCCHERSGAPHAGRYCRNGRNLRRRQTTQRQGMELARQQQRNRDRYPTTWRRTSFFHASDAKSGTLAKYIQDNVSSDVEVMVTDEMPAYPKAMIGAGVHGSKHKTIRHRDKVYVVGDVHTNTVENAFSLLKRGIMGTWHKISAQSISPPT